MAAAAVGRSTLHGASDNEKRWVVFGIVLNKVLVDQVRSFVESEVKREYDNLKTSHAVHTQSTSGRLKTWKAVLKYENINGNDALPKKPDGKYDYSAFDCKITSHVDFAKLYVENFMAKFNAFDEHCDASVVLSLLGKVPIFSTAVQSAAGDVRLARNSWAHCAFSDWEPVKFRQSFDEMKQLVKALGLPAADEAKIFADLKDWETKGTLFCMNASVDPALLHLVQQHVNALKTDVDSMAFEVEDNRKEVKTTLQDVKAHLDELEKRVSLVEPGVERLQNEQSAMEENHKSLKLDVEDVQQRVVQVEERMSSVTPQISWEIANCDTDITFFAERHDPDTRQWLFDDFDKWFRDPGDSRAYVLLGDAGVGKSVIAGALAQRIRKAGHLGAAYFCRHYDSTRKDPRYLLGTVACQLCNCNSQYNNMVGGEGGVKTMLGNSKLGVQELFTKLLEEPLAQCTPLRERKLVIIDALDETEYESREDCLFLIEERFHQLPKWLVFFITSRPEHTVQSRLERYNPCVRICAGDSEQRSFYEQHEQDIRRFFEKSLDLSRVHYSLEDLTRKCSGLFLIAFYIVQVLNNPVLSGKMDPLRDVFPGDMDNFFRKNFERLFDKLGKDIFKKLFGCAIAAPSPLPVSIIEYILEKENSNQDAQEVIDVVSQFTVLRRSDKTLVFLHNLIPAWLTSKEKASPKLFIDKTFAGEYLRNVFSEILSAAVDQTLQSVDTLDKVLLCYVSRVAVQFLCRGDGRHSLQIVFKCLTSFHFLEQRVQSGRIEIYHLLEDLKLAAGCSAFGTNEKNILQEIFLALETNVLVLSECPHLLRCSIINASKTVQENVLSPVVLGPSLERKAYDIQGTECLSGWKVFATASDKKTVVGAHGRSLLFVDATTLTILGGPYQVSQDIIKEISQLAFSPDDRLVFFGRLDKWFSVKRGCVEDFSHFSSNSAVHEWGVMASDGQYIVVKRKKVFYFEEEHHDSLCMVELLARWALLEIDQNPDCKMTSCLSQLLGKSSRLRLTVGKQTKRLLECLGMDVTLQRIHEVSLPCGSSCRFCCGKLKGMIESNKEPSLAAIRQLIIDLYPDIFCYQVWNLQTGRPLLYDVFNLGVQLNVFTYVCHLPLDFSFVGKLMTHFSSEKAMSVCNIAVDIAVYTMLLEWLVKKVAHLMGSVGPRKALVKMFYIRMGKPVDPDRLRMLWKLCSTNPLEMSKCLLKCMQKSDIIKWDIFYSFKSNICSQLPTGSQDLFGKDMLFDVCVSPDRKWVVQASAYNNILLLKTGVEEHNPKQEHNIEQVKDFTFTNDGLHLIYSTVSDLTLSALSLETGKVFTSLSRSLLYCTREKQVGYCFRSETEERVISLNNLFNPFKFFPVLPAKMSAIGKSVGAIFKSNVTVRSVSSNSVISLWNTGNVEKGFAFGFISESSLSDSPASVPQIKSGVFSPDGKHIAWHQDNKIQVRIVKESGKSTVTVFETDSEMTHLVDLVFSADSSLLLSCIQDSINDSYFYVWDVQNKAMSTSFKSPTSLAVECFCLSSNKRELILCGEYIIEIWEFDGYPCRLLARTGVERFFNSFQFFQCAVSSDHKLLVCCIANVIILYNFCFPDIHLSKRILRGHVGGIEFCKFLKVNRYLISYGVDGMVFLWDVAESKAAWFVRIAEGQENIVSMALSPEEDKAVCFTSSGRVCCLKLRNLECALSSKLLTAAMEGKGYTARTSPQMTRKAASTSAVVSTSVDDQCFTIRDLEEEFVLKPEDLFESDESLGSEDSDESADETCPSQP